MLKWKAAYVPYFEQNIPSHLFIHIQHVYWEESWLSRCKIIYIQKYSKSHVTQCADAAAAAGWIVCLSLWLVIITSPRSCRSVLGNRL